MSKIAVKLEFLFWEQLVSTFLLKFLLGLGGVPVNQDVLLSCIQFAVDRHQEVVNLIARVTEDVDR